MCKIMMHTRMSWDDGGKKEKKKKMSSIIQFLYSYLHSMNNPAVRPVYALWAILQCSGTVHSAALKGQQPCQVYTKQLFKVSLVCIS